MNKKILIAVGVLSLSACSGGGSGVSTNPVPVQPSAAPASSSVQAFRITIPASGQSSTKSHSRQAKFVDHNTSSIVVITGPTSTGVANPNLQVGNGSMPTNGVNGWNVYINDVSSGSAACGGTIGTPRTCTIQAPTPTTNYDVLAVTFNEALASGSTTAPATYPTAAGLVTNVTPTPGVTTNVAISLGGLPFKTQADPAAANILVPVDGLTHTVSPSLQETDAFGAVITGSTFSIGAASYYLSFDRANQSLTAAGPNGNLPGFNPIGGNKWYAPTDAASSNAPASFTVDTTQRGLWASTSYPYANCPTPVNAFYSIVSGPFGTLNLAPGSVPEIDFLCIVASSSTATAGGTITFGVTEQHFSGLVASSDNTAIASTPTLLNNATQGTDLVQRYSVTFGSMLGSTNLHFRDAGVDYVVPVSITGTTATITI